MERSLILVKPDAVTRGLAGAILGRLESQGLKMIALKMIHIDEALAMRHYAVHQGKPFFAGLISYITSAPVVAAVFEGDNAVTRIRELMGSTNPAKAGPGTIRKDFGLDIEHNAIHGSDSVDTAKKEIELFFSDRELLRYERS